MRLQLAVAGLATSMLMIAGGCSDPSPPPPTPAATTCANPVRGQRYGMCGRITTATAGGAGQRHRLTGAVDAKGTSPVVGTAYSVEGGTFHAAR